MTISPADVASTQFRVVFRGYDIEEVDTFLARLESDLAAQPTPAPALRTLSIAEQVAEQVVDAARAEAADLLAAATARAHDLQREIERLTALRRQAHAAVRAVLEAHERLLDDAAA